MGAIYALITAMSWAAYNLSVRRGIEAMDSGVGYVITLAFGTVANLSLLLLPLPGRGAPMTQSISILWFVLAGFSTTLLGRWVYFRSVALIGPSRASAWKNASPIYTLVLAFFFLGERPGILALTGTAAVMVGLAILSREQSKAMKQAPVEGGLKTVVMLGLATGLAFSFGTLLRKAGLNHWPDAAMGSAIGGVAAMMAYMPTAFAKGEVKRVPKAPWAGVSAFLIAGIFSTVAQVCTFLSLRVAMAVTTQVVAASEPIFTIALSALLMKRQERINSTLWGSVLLICLGVVLMAR